MHTAPLTTVERIEQHGRLDVPDTVRRIFEQAQQAADQVDLDLKPQVVGARRAQIWADATERAAAAFADYDRAESDKIEAQIELLKKEARGDVPLGEAPYQTSDEHLKLLRKEARADALDLRRTAAVPGLLAFVQASDDPDEIADALEDAVLAGHGYTVRHVAPIALTRLDRLIAKMSKNVAQVAQASAAQARRHALAQQVGAFRKANPSTSERLRTLQARRDRDGALRAQHFETFQRAFGVGAQRAGTVVFGARLREQG